MDPKLVIILIKIIVSVNSAIINNVVNNTDGDNNNNLDNVFNGVYVECFMHLSYLCIQKKTLMYLKELNTLSEVSVIGDYVKFVKLNTTVKEERQDDATNTEELAFMIDRAVDAFFENHVLKFNALGKDIIMPRNVEEFVGRKKRKGGGGGGGGHMSDDGGKKKMMMMAMMCMKMKLMMMVPAMMGMMGMMSFKGMMFSMMSFMMSKMMLLMKLLEKKGGGGGIGGGGGGGGDGGWVPGGGGGGAWMPAGGQDYGGGGYDANGQWQSRSIIDPVTEDIEHKLNKPTITYVTPIVSYNNAKTNYKTPVLVYKKSNVNFEFDDPVNSIDHDDRKRVDSLRRKRDLLQKHYNIENDDNLNQEEIDEHRIIKKLEQNENLILNDPNWNLAIEDTAKPRTRIKRGLIDLLQNSYLYWMNQFLGLNNNRRTAFQKYKVVNGVKYVYYPYPFRVLKQKTPKDIRFTTDTKATDEGKPVIAAEDFNKGEIMEGGVQSRMHKKKLNKMKDTVDEALEDNPWE